MFKQGESPVVGCARVIGARSGGINSHWSLYGEVYILPGALGTGLVPDDNVVQFRVWQLVDDKFK